MNENEKLSPFHIAVLVFMSQMGIVVFTLPNSLAVYFGTNGWLFLLICFVVSTINIYFISLVFRLGKGRSVFEILERSIPKAVLYPVYIGLASVWILFGSMIGKKYVLLFQMMAFPTTNPMVIKLAIDILVYLLLIKGIYNISKAATFFFWITLWMYPLMFMFLPHFHWIRLTPFIFKEGHDMVKGGVDIYASFLGYELFILLFPYMDQKKKPMLAIYSGNAFVTFIYIWYSLTCFGLFSLKQLKKLLFPLLDLQALLRFPFVERLENLLFGFYLFLVLITVVMYLLAAQEAVRRITPIAKSHFFVFITIAVGYGISYIPKSIDQVNDWIMKLGYTVTGIGFGIPIIAILVLLIQGKGGQSHV
ncbi:GerAB/ArcD/ProY family transporter [Paenibacillus wynnii]|uniref:GerAB/ArcD/ProY family transporter n=1 Tax=Paenibacillus wynnii TaxID=268407 RepID=UPI0027901EEF|nr:GerAB/ArcD/ProY family transporter [Paenibacillus wynnii]MDQ0194617.1 spore germination protein (amino acid permease) [Paenibacillus wynnii]